MYNIREKINPVRNKTPEASAATPSAKRISNGIKPTLNKVLSFFWIIAISLSIIWIASAAAPNPGHTISEIGNVAQGDILYGSATDVISALAKNITATRYLSNTGATNNPAWAQVDLTNGVTGVLPVANGGSPTMTTVTTRPASGLGTGANSAVALSSLTVYIVGLFNIPYSITVNQLAYNVGAVTTAGSYRICVYNEAGTTKSIDVTDVPTAGVNTIAVSAVTLTPGNYYIAMGCATTCSNTIFKFTSVANTMINTSAVPAGKKVYEGTATMTSGTCDATLPTITGVISDTAVVRLDN